MTTALLERKEQDAAHRAGVIDQGQRSLDRYCVYLEKLSLGRGLKGQALTDHRMNVAVAAAGSDPMTGQPLYTIDDFRSWWQRAESMGAKPSALDGNVVGRLYRVEIVPNARLRMAAEAVLVGSHHTNENGTITLDTLADAMGVSGSTYASRLLGIIPQGDGYLKWYLGYDQATAAARVLGVPYQELGL